MKFSFKSRFCGLLCKRSVADVQSWGLHVGGGGHFPGGDR